LFYFEVKTEAFPVSLWLRLSDLLKWILLHPPPFVGMRAASSPTPAQWKADRDEREQPLLQGDFQGLMGE